MSFKVKVKWSKEKYDDVDIDTNEPPMTFKMQLYSLTKVPPERQKLMIAGTTIADDVWSEKAKGKIKPNCTFLLMGSADKLPAPPAEKTKFIEDMSEMEAAAVLELPFGIRNLGNTCYMNATLQCLRSIPELRIQVDKFSSVASAPSLDVVAQQMTSNMSILFTTLERGEPQMAILMFLRSLHAAVPHFAEKDDRTGTFRQQDAHECWSTVICHLNQSLVKQDIILEEEDTGITLVGDNSFIQQYMELKLQNTYKCLESDEEMEVTEIENSFQLSCFIEQEIKYLHTGLAKGLKGTVEKHSAALGRDATYDRTTTIVRLPAYLTIQFVRFYHGRAGQSEELVSKKILKDVKFPLKLDMFEFCSTQLQERMLPIRQKFKNAEEQKMVLDAKLSTSGAKSVKTGPPPEYEPYSFEDDPGTNSSGYFDLIAVLTHQGRSSSSGHYVAWVKKGPDQWYMYDDADVTMVTDEDIKKLSGGGDWHTAYILVYGPRKLEILPS